MSQMIEMKVAEAIGPTLDWMVAQIDGVKTLMMSPRKGEPQKPFALFGSLALSVGGNEESSYAPSSCWHCGGPLIEKYRLTVSSPLSQVHRNGGPNAGYGPSGCWTACTWNGRRSVAFHETSALVAACRAIVTANLGETVMVPAELIQ